MDLIKASLRKPISVMVAVLALCFFSAIAIRNISIDIFPKLGIPTIYVAQPYGGLSPEQMEGHLSSIFEQHFIYITGVKFIESKSIQGMSLIKLQFHEDTDMAAAMAQIVAQVNRASGKMPPGTIAPFVVRYDAGNVPVGQLVFSSPNRSQAEVQDLAVNRVRPMFSSLPGVSSPPPVGGNQRSIVVHIEPEKLRSYKLSTEDVVQAIAAGNALSPAGSIRMDDKEYLVKPNAIVQNIQELGDIPLKPQRGASVHLKDIATIKNSADITTGYALVDGQRSVYIPVNKRADASTWTVVQNVKKALPDMQAAIPEDIKLSYAFDQSSYVIDSLKNIFVEGLIASILTGIMVVLFLGDRRSGLIVIITIPLALLSSVILLYAFGQSLNVMTLVGLALSIGVLVDEATVTIENIHSHLERGKSLPKAIADGCREIVIPKLLIVLSILSVFAPSFFMSGVPKSMFLPLSLAVGFAMIASFLLSQSLVPVLSNWVLDKDKLKRKQEENEQGWFSKILSFYKKLLPKMLHRGKWITPIYFILGISLMVLLYTGLGREIFPQVDAGQLQMRIKAPEGTRIERTEELTKAILKEIDALTGGQVEISSAYVGTVPSAYPALTAYIWNNGPHVAILSLKLKEGSGIRIEELREKIREMMKTKFSTSKISFEPADLVDRVMSMGSSTPIEIAVASNNFKEARSFSEKLLIELNAMDYLRDVQINQPLDYPTLKVDIDRIRAGQLGLSASEVSEAMVSATSSSRFTRPVFWLDESSGNAYQVQVEVPQDRMGSEEDLANIMLPKKYEMNNRLADVANISKGSSNAEVQRLDQRRLISISANLHGKTIGQAQRDLKAAIEGAGEQPRGMKVHLRGQLEFLGDTMNELQTGLLIALVVIFIMLTINFQSFSAALSTLSNVPAVAVGAFLALYLTGSTLNIQSYMGVIMALGVSVANAILFTTFAEEERKRQKSSGEAALEAGKSRLRPILMTSISMLVGLIPLALGGDQTAPLGIAVMGGLFFATLTTLLVMPGIYTALMRKATSTSLSLDPYDTNSKYFENE